MALNLYVVPVQVNMKRVNDLGTSQRIPLGVHARSSPKLSVLMNTLADEADEVIL